MGLWVLLPLAFSVSLRVRAWDWELGVEWEEPASAHSFWPLCFSYSRSRGKHTGLTILVCTQTLGLRRLYFQSCQSMCWSPENTEASVSHGPGPEHMVLRTGLYVRVSGVTPRGSGLSPRKVLLESQLLGYAVLHQVTIYPASPGPAIQCIWPGSG